MSSSQKTSDGDGRVDNESDQHCSRRRTSSNRSARHNLPRPPLREDASTDSNTSINHTYSTTRSPRSRQHYSPPPRLLAQRVAANALVPATSRNNSNRHIPFQSQSVNIQNNFEEIRTSSYRGYNSSSGEFVVFSCVTNRPFSVSLTSQGIGMRPSSNQPGFNMGNVGNGQDVPNGYLSQDQPRRQSEFTGNQNQQQMQRVHRDPSNDGAAPSISHHHGTSFNFYFVNSGTYGLNFSGNALPAAAPQPPPPYLEYAGAGPFGSNPFPGPHSQNSSMVANTSSGFHSNPFPSHPTFQSGYNHQHHQQFPTGQLPPQGAALHYPPHMGGNSGRSLADHRAANVELNSARSLSQSSFGDTSLYGDENETENASQQSHYGGICGPCTTQGFFK